MMSYWKSLQISLLFHAIILFAVINLNTMSLIRPQEILVIDFSMEGESFLREGNGTAAPSLPAKSHKDRKKTHVTETLQDQQSDAPSPTVIPESSDKDEIPQKETVTSVMTVSENNLAAGPVFTEFSNYGARGSLNAPGTGTGGSSSGAKTTSAGGAAASAKTKYLKAHYSYIKDLILKHLIYPAKARRMGWEGKVITSFIVSSAGNAKDVRIARSSGHQILDESAVRAINDASPFPKPPAEAQIIIPILYRLN